MSDSITRWEPMREMVTLREAIGRLFDDSTIRPGSLAGAGFEGPAVDVYQTKDDVIVKAAVPGLDPEDIDVSVTGDMLTIKGEFKQEEKVEKEQYVYQERRFGQFCRQMSLPARVKADKASAEYEHGVLTLKLPKVEEAKPKGLKIKVK
ncbi:MAG: Hsp20/alpha crystallin family protein [Thermoflexales bacterium]|nr:Hsp20/alpha crystallin family protein [Thermoflexales bacterium]